MKPYRHERESRDPEHEVEEEHGVLDTGGDVREAARDAPPTPHRPARVVEHGI